MALWKCAGATAGVAYACTDTCTGAPAVSFRVAAAIRISIASPSTSVACTVLPAMRMATVRPLQRAERQAAPLGRKFRVNCKRVTPQIEAGEAEDHRLPQRAQPGDAHATGAVRVGVEVGGCGLAQIA